jgi:hypothetical protein
MAVYAVSVYKLLLTVMFCTDTVVVLCLRKCPVLTFFMSFLCRGRNRGSLSNRVSNSGRQWTAQYNAMQTRLREHGTSWEAEEHVPHERREWLSEIHGDSFYTDGQVYVQFPLHRRAASLRLTKVSGESCEESKDR